MAQNTDFGQVANDLRNAATQFAALTSSATLLGQALGTFREFEKQLTLTNAIAQGTVAQFEQMKQAARDFSLVTTTSATDAGRALQQLAQAGFTAQQSLNAMNGVLLLAQATLSDVGLTSDVLSSNIRAFKLEAQDTTRVANVFAAAITGSLATMDKLAFAFRQVAPVAELAGLSIEETTASLATLFNVGLRGEQAGTALRNIIIRLVRPLGEAGDLLRDAGIATRTATGELRNLADIMSDIADSDLSNADLARIFETEALAGVKAYISALKDIEVNGKSAYENLLSNITNTDRAVELAAANLETFDGAMRLLGNSVSDVQKDLGEALAPVLIEMADTIRNLISSFRELDPEMQQSIVRTVAFGTAAAGILITLGLLASSLRAIGAIHLIRFAAGLTAAAGGLTGMATAAAVLLARIGALIPGITIGLTALGSVGAIAAGFGVLTAAIGGTIFAVDSLITTASELDDALKIDSDAFRIARANAVDTADRILGKGLETEIAGRVSAIQRQLQIISVASPQDRFGFSGRKGSRAKEEAKLAEGALADLTDEFDEVRKYFQLEQALIEELEKDRQERDKGLVERGVGLFLGYSVEGRTNTYLKNLYDQLDEEQKAALDVLRERGGDLVDADLEARKLVAQLQKAETEAIVDFLDQLALGQATVRKENAAVASFIEENDILSGIDVNALAEAIASQEGATTEQEILRRALEQAGVPAEDIIKLFEVFQEEKTNQLIAGLANITSGFEEDLKQVQADLAQQQADEATTLAEAVRLATEGGLKQMEIDLSGLADDLKDKYADVLVDFGVDFREGVIEGIQAVVGETIDLGKNAPGFAELVDGTWLVDSINSQIDESTTLKEAEEIIAKEFDKYRAIFEAYIEAMIAAGTIDAETADAIREAVAASSELMRGKFLEGLGDTADDIESQTKRIERANKAASKAGDNRLREAKKALARERKIEDIYNEIAGVSRDAREALFNATRGIDLSGREDFLLGLEIEEIIADYDKQITSLKRKLEDIELDFGGTPAQLAEIKEGYSAVIQEIEAARDAEIKAANSFTAMMERRSKALDLFRRDLQDVAFEANDTATKVGAGIALAFTDYQENLVTLTDITRDAVGGTLDALTTGIADFIFDNENAWENFKKSMLRISREIFEGFTKAFLQQAISSLTGGEGSIFSNALQPGKGAGQGVPGVGTGGILGSLFPGLAGAFGKDAPPSGPGAGAAGAVADAQAAQFDATMQTFNARMQQTTQTTVQAMQSIAQTFQQTAASIGAGGGVGAIPGVGAITGAVSGIPGGGAITSGLGGVASAAVPGLGAATAGITAAAGIVSQSFNRTSNDVRQATSNMAYGLLDMGETVTGVSKSISGLGTDMVKFGDSAISTRELLARAIQGEAGSEGPVGMLAAGAVMRNRAAVPGYGGDTLGETILSPGAFSMFNGVTGYAGGAGGNAHAYQTPGSAAYAAADTILSGNYVDPTSGATHYYANRGPNAISVPSWARSGSPFTRNQSQIGNHLFGSAEGVIAPPPMAASLDAATTSLTGFAGGLDTGTTALTDSFEVLGNQAASLTDEFQRYGTVFDPGRLSGKERDALPNDSILNKIGAATTETFGPGSRVEMFSGKGHASTGTGTNHPGGYALDFDVFDPSGMQVLPSDQRFDSYIDNAARMGVTGIGAGAGYMGGDSFHFDETPGFANGHYWGRSMVDSRISRLRGINPNAPGLGGFDTSLLEQTSAQFDTSMQEMLMSSDALSRSLNDTEFSFGNLKDTLGDADKSISDVFGGSGKQFRFGQDAIDPSAAGPSLGLNDISTGLSPEIFVPGGDRDIFRDGGVGFSPIMDVPGQLSDSLTKLSETVTSSIGTFTDSFDGIKTVTDGLGDSFTGLQENVTSLFGGGEDGALSGLLGRGTDNIFGGTGTDPIASGMPGAGAGLGGAVGGIFGAGGGTGQLLGGLQQTMQQVSTFAQSTIQQAVTSIGTDLTLAGTQTAQRVRQGGDTSARGLDDAGTKISGAADQAASKVASSGNAAAVGAGSSGGGFGSLLSTGLSLIGGLFADGGDVGAPFGMRGSEGGYTGYGMTYDPAGIVHRGEYVINKRQASKWRPFLDMVNNGKLQPGTAMFMALGNGRDREAGSTGGFETRRDFYQYMIDNGINFSEYPMMRRLYERDMAHYTEGGRGLFRGNGFNSGDFMSDEERAYRLGGSFTGMRSGGGTTNSLFESEFSELRGVPGFAAGGFVGGGYTPPAATTSAPRSPSVTRGTGKRGGMNDGNTTNIKATYIVHGATGSRRETKRSADQFAKRLGQQLDKAKRNT